MSARARVGMVLYAALFCVALPWLLWAWARGAAGVVRLPALHLPAPGIALAALGLSLVALGMAALWIFARGLPMNAFPPARFVTQGVYRTVPHPIYVGFCLAVLGAALASGSASGLWLVFPATCAGCVALVLGYEGPDLRRRFGPQPPPLLWLPPDTQDPATGWDRAAGYLLAAVPWCALYGAMILLGTPANAVDSYLAFEERLPVLEAAELLYASAYPVLAFALFVPRTRGELRAVMAQVLLSCALVFPLYLTLPLVAPPRPFVATTWPGHALLLERSLDTPGAAFPSFHVILALLSARAIARRAPRFSWLAWTWALGVAASCVLTGQHSIADVLAGAVAAWACVRAPALWEGLRAWAERTANRFAAIRLGPARVLLHSGWAGAGAACGVLSAAAMLGPGQAALALFSGLGGLVGAFLFARIIERPQAQARPYGYWGGVLGVILAATSAPLWGQDPWLLLAGFCAAGPLVQALGRIRCLGQGCCHGAPCGAATGIRVLSPLSRVAKAGLGGAPIHPTQLYSILWAVPCTLVLARLWWLHVPDHFLCGVYLVLAGLGRFVEEAYRGEPQTRVVLGLRVYQWIALASLCCGAALTALGASAPVPWPRIDLGSLCAAVAFGLVCWGALGVDFPTSERHFSRLA